MSWYRVTFTTNDIVGKKHTRLHDDFNLRWMAAGSPRGAALFASGLDRAGRSVYYFSPDSMSFARPIVAAYAGEPHGPPPRGVALDIGHASAPEELLG